MRAELDAAAAMAATGVVRFSRCQLIAARQRLEAVRGQFSRRQPGFPFDSTVWHLALLEGLASG